MFFLQSFLSFFHNVCTGLCFSYFLYSHGDFKSTWKNIISWLNIVNNDDESYLLHNFNTNRLISHKKTLYQLPIREQIILQPIFKIIQYEFKYPQLLLEALTHTSYESTDVGCYQRLEFLGDALLDMIIVQHLYDNKQQLDPGFLTDILKHLGENKASTNILLI